MLASCMAFPGLIILFFKFQVVFHVVHESINDSKAGAKMHIYNKKLTNNYHILSNLNVVAWLLFKIIPIRL